MKEKIIKMWNDPSGKRKLIIAGVVIVFVIVVIIAGSIAVMSKRGEKPEEKMAASPSSAPTPTPVPAYEEDIYPTDAPEPTIPQGMAQSPLTGEYVDDAVAATRPFAIMFNNLSVASPQSGIAEMDILYECVTEGGITRLMGITQSLTSDRIGSIRSARHYYVSFAKEWDAIYIHAGGSDKAYNYITKLGVDSIDGVKGIGGTLIYRDSSIKAPHNAFSSVSRINKSIETLGYRTQYQPVKDNHFTFNDEDTVSEDGDTAEYVSINFSTYTTPYLIYNSGTGLYERYQFGSAHTDCNTNEILTFKNIIIMAVEEWTMDNQGRQDMSISDNSGEGWYITDGKAVKISWTKNESSNQMQFLDAGGNLLSVNKGKTYIAVLPNDRVSSLVFKAY